MLDARESSRYTFIKRRAAFLQARKPQKKKKKNKSSPFLISVTFRLRSIDGQRQTLLAAKAQMGASASQTHSVGLCRRPARSRIPQLSSASRGEAGGRPDTQANGRSGRRISASESRSLRAGGWADGRSVSQSVSQSCATMLRSRVSSTRCAQFNADEMRDRGGR